MKQFKIGRTYQCAGSNGDTYEMEVVGRTETAIVFVSNMSDDLQTEEIIIQKNADDEVETVVAWEHHSKFGYYFADKPVERIFKIFEGNLERLEKKLARIAKKCQKYGCDFKYEKVGEIYQDVRDKFGMLHTARFVLIKTEGTAKVNDWKFVATVDHTEKGNIIRGYAGIEVPERYYEGRPVCEHCNSNRYRKNTYIVQNTVTGEFKQVGKSCLCDFTNGLSAELIAQYISAFQELIVGAAPDLDGAIPSYINKEEYLLYAAETIRLFGYIRRSDDEPGTAQCAMRYYDAAHGRAETYKQLQLLQNEMETLGFNPDSQKQLVADALAWIEQQPESNNYFHNLKVACSLEYVEYRHYGLLASLLPNYNKTLQEPKQIGESVHVGQLKERWC